MTIFPDERVDDFRSELIFREQWTLIWSSNIRATLAVIRLSLCYYDVISKTTRVTKQLLWVSEDGVYRISVIISIHACKTTTSIFSCFHFSSTISHQTFVSITCLLNPHSNRRRWMRMRICRGLWARLLSMSIQYKSRLFLLK